MNTKTISGLFIALLLIVPAATAVYSGSCCEWGTVTAGTPMDCIGSCGPDTQCTQIGDSTDCECTGSTECGWIPYATTAGGYCGGGCPSGEECVGESRECGCQPVQEEECHWEVDECVGTCSAGGSCVMTSPEQCGCQAPTDVCRWGGDGCVGTCSQGGECVQDGDSPSCSCSGTPECVQEGQTYPITYTAAPPECCSGLAAIGCSTPDSEGFCGEPCVGAMVCAQCGNGVCGLGENICNCPADCTKTTSVPEFATGLVALAVMLLSPAFAYLVIRKRH